MIGSIHAPDGGGGRRNDPVRRSDSEVRRTTRPSAETGTVHAAEAPRKTATPRTHRQTPARRGLMGETPPPSGSGDDGKNFDGDPHGDVAMQLHVDRVRAEALDGLLEVDLPLVDGDALGLERVGHLR